MSGIGGWITNGTAVPFYARRLFLLEKKVKKAEAKVCGLGQFLLWVNGKKVGDHELDPGWTDYKKLVEYVVFDVTSYLHTGENVIGAEVGNGWFIKMDEHYTFAFPPFMPPNPNPYQPYGKFLVLAAELRIIFEDGSQMCLQADNDWRVQKHPVIMSNVYGSETIDGRLMPQAEGLWCTAGFDDSAWGKAMFVPEEEAPTGAIIRQAHPPVKVIHTYEGVQLGEVGSQECFCDGTDTSVEMSEGETGLPAGTFENRADMSARRHEGGGDLPMEMSENRTNSVRRIIYDFGQNMSGLLEFEAKGHAGDVVKIYTAEKLTADGDVDQMAKNWMNLDNCMTCILGVSDEWQRFRMKFTYFAGRYAAVEMIPGAAQTEDGEQDEAAKRNETVKQNEAATQDEASNHGAIEIRGLVAHALTSAWKTDGEFQCDDPRYNQIYDMIVKTVEANMTAGVHTDCPTIERFAWQEPNHLMAPSILFMKDGRLLWEKFLLDMRVGQHTAQDWFNDMQGGRYYPGEGMMPAQCPCYIPNVLPVPGMGSFYDIIAWGSTCILGTYWHYQFYGDPKIIEDNYDAGMRYLNHLKTKVTAEGFINHGLGDWGNPRGDFARENVETAFLYADVMTLAYFAEVLEKTEPSAYTHTEGRDRAQGGPESGPLLTQDSSATRRLLTQDSSAAGRLLAQDREELLAYGEAIKDNYNKKLLTWNEEQGFWCYRAWDHPDELFLTQATEALPLYWGLVPADKEADVARALRYVLERDGALISGEVGLPYVIQSARKYGMNDIISRFILKEEHPSYYAFILDGETTLGEYWETNPRSHCHDMMGHIIEWYYNGIAGILCEEPGFARIRICPYLPESMTTFTCSYMSVKGLIRVEVTKHEEENGKAPAGESMENGKASAGESAENGKASAEEKARCISERGQWIQLNITVPEQVEYTIDTSCLESQADRVEVKLERSRD